MINRRRTARTSLKRLRGLDKSSPNQTQVIHGRHEQCRWRGSWANLLHFAPNLNMYRHNVISLKMQQIAQLHRHGYCSWRPCMTRLAFLEALVSP